MGNAEKVRRLLRQQAALAAFGTFALRQNDLPTILTEAARACAVGLDVPFCKICRYRAAENDLLVEAGHGWQEGVIGKVVSRADESSPQGRAFITGQPSICHDLRKDKEFDLPAFYAAHGIVSTIDVLIRGNGRPYGVLEIDSSTHHNYDQHDVDFLTGFANVLAEAVATTARTAILKTTVEQMQSLVEEKDRLLEQKNVLAEELQHRVRNNLMLVHAMLSKHLNEPEGEAGRRDIRSIARRVSSLARVYDHLLGNELALTVDFGAYVKALCFDIADVRGAPDGEVTLTCESDSLILDLDVVMALGIVVTELVSNSFDHAFSGTKGETIVSVRRDVGGDAATLTVSDGGKGFDAKAESRRRGLGLVRRLVEQVRGTATVASDHGTVWTIRFPVSPPTDRVSIPA